LRLTFQVTDGFLRPIRKTRSVLRAQKTVVEQNTAEGVSPNGVLRNPNRPIRAVSSYRMLCGVNACPLLIHIIIHIYYHIFICMFCCIYKNVFIYYFTKYFFCFTSEFRNGNAYTLVIQ